MTPEILDAEAVDLAYRLMLGRPPENERVINAHIEGARDQRQLVGNIARSEEFASRVGLNTLPQSPFWHFNSSVEVRELILTYAKKERQPVPGHYVNFLGVAIPTRVMTYLNDKGGQLDPIPIPANFHADMAEWAGALHAVERSASVFTMLELGCGWGCWMNNTGVAARSRGKQLDLIGIEGDDLHIDMAKETLSANGIAPANYVVHKGIAAAADGFALFPRRRPGAEAWGAEPKFGLSEVEAQYAMDSGDYEREETISLQRAVGERPRIDLLHVDIQGGEDQLIPQSLMFLNERVASILIGTHSRSIEGRLIEVLQGSGWQLQIERPAIIALDGGVPRTTVDGVQAWFNPRLARS